MVNNVAQQKAAEAAQKQRVQDAAAALLTRLASTPQIGAKGLASAVPPQNISFDSMELAKVLPYTPLQMRDVATKLDSLVLGIDIISECVVLGHVAVGAAGGLTFEGNPVSGAVGAGAGWILGETNPGVQGLITIGNYGAALATGSNVLADIKSGDTRLQFQGTQDGNHLTLTGNAAVSSNTLSSSYLTVLGFNAHVVELSLLIQGGAVALDHGVLPTQIFSREFNLDIQLPSQ